MTRIVVKKLVWQESGNLRHIQKHKELPKFKTIEEEARFWDTHSFSDYWDDWEDVDIVFELKKPREETLIVRLQKNIKERLERIARSKGLNVSTLARMWLMEKMQVKP